MRFKNQKTSSIWVMITINKSYTGTFHEHKAAASEGSNSTFYRNLYLESYDHYLQNRAVNYWTRVSVNRLTLLAKYFKSMSNSYFCREGTIRTKWSLKTTLYSYLNHFKEWIDLYYPVWNPSILVLEPRTYETVMKFQAKDSSLNIPQAKLLKIK